MPRRCRRRNYVVDTAAVSVVVPVAVSAAADTGAFVVEATGSRSAPVEVRIC